jgi:hypothetical protein
MLDGSARFVSLLMMSLAIDRSRVWAAMRSAMTCNALRGL